jgi:hypothetical protein
MTEPRALTGPEIIAHVREADNFHLHGDAYWSSVVIAVLDAIREPSEAMVDAACKSTFNIVSHPAIWRAMVDALKREVAG